MNLYILRHGIAVERGAPGYSNDADRPLTPKGERKLWQAAEAMEALGLSFDVILTSPFVRARQTADVIAEAFNARKWVETTDSLAPSGSTKALIDRINRLKPPPEDVLLVGHEPYLSELISLLVTGASKMSLALKKGGLCKLEVARLTPGRCAALEWLLTPKQMGLIS
jgi:phosphohistidine phosphatase